MRLLLVGDGPRDAATVPHLVAAVLGCDVSAETRPWARLRGGKGYDRKLRFATLQARDLGVRGLVVVIDRERDGQGRRVKALRSGRDLDRSTHPPFPTAIGEAIPTAKPGSWTTRSPCGGACGWIRRWRCRRRARRATPRQS